MHLSNGWVGPNLLQRTQLVESFPKPCRSTNSMKAGQSYGHPKLGGLGPPLVTLDHRLSRAPPVFTYAPVGPAAVYACVGPSAASWRRQAAVTRVRSASTWSEID